MLSRKFFLLSLACTAASAFAAEVNVDWNAPVGPVKPIHGVGQPPMIGAPSSFPMMHYLKRAGIPYSRLHDVGGPYGGMRYVDIPNIFRDFDADENDPKNYDFMATDKLMLALAANGIEPFYRLGVTIENSAGAGFPAYRIFPPKDYAKWARVCEHVIRHYTEGWADGYRLKVTYWEIWNEPENHPDPEKNPMFRAPFEEYMRLYGTVAPYLKAKFPHLKIGGYGHCGFYAAVGSDLIPAANTSPRKEYFVECSHKFLKAAKENKWPLDFFSYHSYSDPVEALRQVRYARELLDSYGFTDVPTCFNEWLPLPSLASRGTPHQAAMIAAELIGLQNGPCDMAMVYDARCGVGNYSPLFNPLTETPHKAYFAFLAFNQLYQLGTAVKAVSSDTNLWVAAARKDERGAIMFANYSDHAIPLDLKADGLRHVSWNITSPDHWDEYFSGKPLRTIPADSFVVCFYNSVKPSWERPKTTRRYLQGPLASRLAVLFREGKLLLGDLHHVHDWRKVPYSSVWAHGVWLTHGERLQPFDFRKAELSLDPEAVPIAAQKWREGDLEVTMEACAPFGRFPNAHLRVKATNRGASHLKDDFAFLVRLAPEQDLVYGAPDGYVSYRPEVGQWLGAPNHMSVSSEDGALRNETIFVKFGDATPFVWDKGNGAARFAIDLQPGETRTIDCVIGRDETERPHYDEVRARVRADWLKELKRVDGRSALVRNLTVQMLQNFARPTKGDYILPRQGGLQRWVWPGDNRAVCAALDRLGYGEYVDQAVDFYFGQYQQPSGEVGKFGNGWANDTASCLTILSRHALALAETDPAAAASFWKARRDAAAKAYGWIRDTRERDGLFPAMKSADSEKVFRNWGGTDCTNLEALECFAKAARRMDDPIADEVFRTAAEYRAAIGGFLQRWREAAKGRDEFAIPFAPDGSNEEAFAQSFYYSHPGQFAKMGFLNEDELHRVRNWMVRTGVANPEKGLYMISRDGVIGRGAEGNFWYMTWAEHRWFNAWRRVGRDDLARQALDACLKYALTDEYQVGERYQAADPWLYPWAPNASGSGRIVQMLLDLEDDSTDVLQRALDSDEKTVVIDGNRKWVTRPLFIRRSNFELVFRDGAKLVAKRGAFKGRNDTLLKVTDGCTNVTIRGEGRAELRMWMEDYDNANLYRIGEWRHGLAIWGATNVTVRNLTVTRTGGDCVYVVGAKNLLLEDIVTDDAYRLGLGLISGEDVTVRNCTFRNTYGTPPKCGVDLEPNKADQRLTNILFENCLFEKNASAGALMHLAQFTEKTEPVSILFRNCVARGNVDAFRITAASAKGIVRGSVVFENCRSEGNALDLSLRNTCEGCVTVTERGCNFTKRYSTKFVMPAGAAPLVFENVKPLSKENPAKPLATDWLRGGFTFVQWVPKAGRYPVRIRMKQLGKSRPSAQMTLQDRLGTDLGTFEIPEAGREIVLEARGENLYRLKFSHVAGLVSIESPWAGAGLCADFEIHTFGTGGRSYAFRVPAQAKDVRVNVRPDLEEPCQATLCDASGKVVDQKPFDGVAAVLKGTRTGDLPEEVWRFTMNRQKEDAFFSIGAPCEPVFWLTE